MAVIVTTAMKEDTPLFKPTKQCVKFLLVNSKKYTCSLGACFKFCYCVVLYSIFEYKEHLSVAYWSIIWHEINNNFCARTTGQTWSGICHTKTPVFCWWVKNESSEPVT